MTTGLNEQTVLLALGVLQPASAAEVRGYMTLLFPEAGVVPTTEDFEAYLIEQESHSRVLTVETTPERRFSLTYAGSARLDPVARRIRDKLRLYLLRDAHKRRFIVSRAGVAKELAGASPAMDVSTTIKSREANDLGLRYSLGQARWPRVSRQFRKTGSSPSARDTLPKLISFLEPWQLRLASGEATIGPLPDEVNWNYVSLATAIGISPGLLVQIVRKPTRHYRIFSMKKRGGGIRTIESPRVFLKVVQWLLQDFVLPTRLKISDACHAFVTGRTIVSNAQVHSGARFVGTVDITKFFNSVTTEQVYELLLKSHFTKMEAFLISSLCTNEGHLPQGAPTSPMISNALLYELDEMFSREAQVHRCRYSRYADDITISGASREIVTRLLSEIGGFLTGRYNLKLNHEKTRVASSSGRQMVTGAVVNTMVHPPRDYRKKIRAIFHQAANDPTKYGDRISELVGYIGFLGQYSTPAIAQSISRYRQTLDVLRKSTPASKEAAPPKVRRKRRSSSTKGR